MVSDEVPADILLVRCTPDFAQEDDILWWGWHASWRAFAIRSVNRVYGFTILENAAAAMDANVTTAVKN